MTIGHAVVRLIGPPEADAEYIALRSRGSGDEIEIVHLHDYERVYSEPGLYEHIVQELLGCRSPQVAADAFADALTELALDPSEVVLLDLGAGTGVVGELVSAVGISTIVGVDALDAARTACLRDRPGTYADYLTGDLASPAPKLLKALAGHRPTALISAGALGGTHGSGATLVNALALLPAGSPVVFTIDERWMQTDRPGGFRTVMSDLVESRQFRLLSRMRFQHRVSTSGEPIYYELIVAVTGSDNLTS
ncbi:MAG TPA: hypothetical protein VMA77_05480 [Solirubrobacteraceae bacterium]|nr:hypothetical protein [Solirubrobacteraceae bacterium]